MTRNQLLSTAVATLVVFIFVTSCVQLTTTHHKSDFIHYKEIGKELDSLYDKDQGMRERLTEMIVNQEPFDQAFVDSLNRSDSLNQVRVVQILNKYGWLPQDSIGVKAFGALFLVIQHADVEVMERFYPSFQVVADEHPDQRIRAAMMQDRILMYRSKRQIYGTQSSSRVGEDGKPEYFIWPVEKPEMVNERRREIGFSKTIEEYAASMGATYNPDETLGTFGEG